MGIFSFLFGKKSETEQKIEYDPFNLASPDGFVPVKNPYKGTRPDFVPKDFTGEPHCPYCEILLTKIPSRKTKCKNCEKFYFYNNFPYENKKILTEEENERAKKANNELYSSYRFLDEISDYTEKNFYKIFEEKYQNGEDFLKIISEICDEIIEDLKKGNYFHTFPKIYFRKAVFLYDNNGDFYEDLKKSNKYDLSNIYNDLKEFEKHYHIGVRIIGIKGTGVDNTKILSFEEEFKNQTLPHRNCYNPKSPGWCGCCYCGYLGDEK